MDVRMSAKKTLLLIVVCAAILFFYFQDKEKVAQEQKIEEQKKEFIVAESDDIMSLAIERDGQVIKAVRDGEDWNIVEPIDWQGEKFAWKTIADNLANAKIERRFPAEGEELTEKDLQNWELKPEHLKLTALVREGSKEHTFRFGVKPPGSTSSVFALADDASGEAFIVPHSIVFSASKTLFDLRNRKIFEVRFDHDDLKQLEVKNKDLEFNAKIDGEGNWVFADRGGIRADPAQIRPFLQKLNEEAKAILDNVPDARVREYGLAEDQLASATSIKAVYGSEGTLGQFYIGGYDLAEGGHIGKRAGVDSLFVIKDQSFEGLATGLEGLRPTKAIPLDTYNTEVIEATKDGQTYYRLTKKDFNWMMGIPHDATAERDTVEGLLRAFNDHKIKSYIEDASGDAALGLENPALIFHVTGKENKEETLLLGNKNGLGQVYAAWKGYPDRFLINQNILDTLNPESPLDLLIPAEKERLAPVLDLTAEPQAAGDIDSATGTAEIEVTQSPVEEVVVETTGEMTVPAEAPATQEATMEEVETTTEEALAPEVEAATAAVEASSPTAGQ
jgi:hypothetical protein